MNKTVAIIPARYASSRFPGKMLADATGKPLIQHVYERAIEATTVDQVIIATDDERIADAARQFGATVEMTSPDHPNGTSRLAEVTARIDADIIVNVQGDEPELDPGLIDRAVDMLHENERTDIATIGSPFANDEDPANPNIVKVVLDQHSHALYFSRALIPHDRDGVGTVAPLKHVGMYVYRRAALLAYPLLESTPLEQAECLEQLRWLERGYTIAVAVAQADHCGIDTPEQYETFVERASRG